jgi:hypothetical protein
MNSVLEEEEEVARAIRAITAIVVADVVATNGFR